MCIAFDRSQIVILVLCNLTIKPYRAVKCDLRDLYFLHFSYTQLGQALSTRPDILPTVYCNELAKLQVF